jgi:hypothetical protein
LGGTASALWRPVNGSLLSAEMALIAMNLLNDRRRRMCVGSCPVEDMQGTMPGLRRDSVHQYVYTTWGAKTEGFRLCQSARTMGSVPENLGRRHESGVPIARANDHHRHECIRVSRLCMLPRRRAQCHAPGCVHAGADATRLRAAPVNPATEDAQRMTPPV